MDFVNAVWKNESLAHTDEGRNESMISEENVIKVDLACLVWINEVAIGVVDGVEEEASQVHGNEIEVHAFDAGWGTGYLLCLKFS